MKLDIWKHGPLTPETDDLTDFLKDSVMELEGAKGFGCLLRCAYLFSSFFHVLDFYSWHDCFHVARHGYAPLQDLEETTSFLFPLHVNNFTFFKKISHFYNFMLKSVQDVGDLMALLAPVIDDLDPEAPGVPVLKVKCSDIVGQTLCNCRYLFLFKLDFFLKKNPC